jgi:hypothetical protein
LDIAKELTSALTQLCAHHREKSAEYSRQYKERKERKTQADLAAAGRDQGGENASLEATPAIPASLGQRPAPSTDQAKQKAATKQPEQATPEEQLAFAENIDPTLYSMTASSAAPPPATDPFFNPLAQLVAPAGIGSVERASTVTLEMESDNATPTSGLLKQFAKRRVSCLAILQRIILITLGLSLFDSRILLPMRPVLARMRTRPKRTPSRFCRVPDSRICIHNRHQVGWRASLRNCMRSGRCVVSRGRGEDLN